MAIPQSTPKKREAGVRFQTGGVDLSMDSLERVLLVTLKPDREWMAVKAAPAPRDWGELRDYGSFLSRQERTLGT